MLTTTGETQIGPFAMRWREHAPARAAGRQVLLLHGLYAGAHSYEWRMLVPVLAERFRVRVPDLLGTSSSDRPDLEYTREVVQSAVDALIADVARDAVIVASSLTGAYALRAVAQGEPTRPTLLITPSGRGVVRERAPSVVNRTLYGLARHTLVGDAFVYALTSAPSVGWFQTHKTYADPSIFTSEEAEATRQAGRLPNAKQLQLAFVFNRLSLDVSTDDIRQVRPTVLWACGQGFVDNAERMSWQQAGATLVEARSGLPHVEDPEQVARLVGELGGGFASEDDVR
jgi:pimeloyl-ACP methyl ester carboxylesterase